MRAWVKKVTLYLRHSRFSHTKPSSPSLRHTHTQTHILHETMT